MKKYIIILCLSIQGVLLFSQTQSFYIIPVDGSCGMCQERIETIISNIEYVEGTQWDINTKQLAIIADRKFDIMTAHEALSTAGHDTDQILSPDNTYNNLPACCSFRDQEKSIYNDFNPKNKVDLSIWVDGLCDMCQDRIHEIISHVDGIKKPHWDIESKILTFKTSADFNLRPLYDAITEGGHDTEFLDAPDEAYDDLHVCCKYRDEEMIKLHQDQQKDDHDHRGQNTNPHSSENIDDSIIQGMVYESNQHNQKEPLIGVNVYWAGDNKGTITDADGFFELNKNDRTENIVFQYVGYENDTVNVAGQHMLAIILSDGHILDQVDVVHRRKSTEVSFLDPMKVQRIGQKELLKAACCNLSESFETTPAMEVSQTDAITGTKKIELLGLQGANIQISRENMPYIRGLSALYGFEYIPGPWIEGIQFNLGAGSVVNGFESITGQINVELKKPHKGERAYLNIYANEGNRLEANFNSRIKVNEKWDTGILFHQKYQHHKADRNNDGFKDHPESDRTMIFNRWKYRDENGWAGQFYIGGIYSKSLSGQLNFNPKNITSDIWGSEVLNKRLEAWAKMGRVFIDRPYASFGIQISAFKDNQDSYYGNKSYNGDQTGLYANVIYQSFIGTTDHTFKSGVSYQLDNINEHVLDTVYTRRENVPGAFFEYSYVGSDKFSTVLGFRGDIHNQYGLFFTPRVHLKYAPKPTSVIRFSVGRGQRTASIFAENIGIFASNRKINVNGIETNSPYGLRPETAWNIGINYLQEWSLNNRPIIFELDLYRTEFSDQVLIDFDADARQVNFYNLDGKSYSNSLQTMISYEVAPRFDVKIAYRYNYAASDYFKERLQRPLTSSHRAFINMAYTTKNDWAFDFTLNRIGSKRLPSTTESPANYQRPDRSPSFLLGNAQISKSFSKRFDLYLGSENIFNYQQENAIVSADDPYNSYFDASMIWAPIFGRKIYTGLRYRWL